MINGAGSALKTCEEDNIIDYWEGRFANRPYILIELSTGGSPASGKCHHHPHLRCYLLCFLSADVVYVL